ncbi:MAG: hypothetical protein AAGI46_10485 [Planctomycetota bacterium]
MTTCVRIIISAAAALVLSTSSSAQLVADLREDVRSSAASSNLSDELQGLSGYTAVPGISSASLSVEQEGQQDLRINRTSFPLFYVFEDLAIGRVKPRVELTLGRTRFREKTDFVFDGQPVFLDNRITSYSAVSGLGVAIDLGPWTVSPVFLAGYSRTDDEARFSGASGSLLESATRGIIFNFEIEEAILGVGVQADYAAKLDHGIAFRARARYNHLFTVTFDASDPVLEGSSNFGVATAFAQLDGPTGLHPLGRQLRWIGFAGNSSFVGVAGEALGFDTLFELGTGVQLVERDLVPFVSGVSLRTSFVFGEGVRGFALGGQIDF